MTANKSVEFFETQFQRQVRERDYALNPFEKRALDYLRGTVLDFGSGLGNLSLEAGRRGHRVVAVDASAAAVARINADAQREGLPVEAIQADVETWAIDRPYDTIVAIGLLMFFRRERALALLRAIQEHVTPGGRAIVNVLIEGTTFMGMFDPDNYYLFGRDELEERFAGWSIPSSLHEIFPAPGGTLKEFSTVIAERPGLNRATADARGSTQISLCFRSAFIRVHPRFHGFPDPFAASDGRGSESAPYRAARVNSNDAMFRTGPPANNAAGDSGEAGAGQTPIDPAALVAYTRLEAGGGGLWQSPPPVGEGGGHAILTIREPAGGVRAGRHSRPRPGLPRPRAGTGD